MRSTRYCTRSNRAVPFAKNRKATSVAITSIATPDVDRTGVNPLPRLSADRMAMSVTIENTNVATKMPSETLVSRDLTKTRTARGEY